MSEPGCFGLVPEEYGGDDVQCVELHRADLEEECPPRTFENQDGTGCEVRENDSPTGAVIDVVPKIWVCQGGIIMNPLDSSYCIWIIPQETTLYDKVPTCDIGTLNEASGMCEVKPGNRGSNRA